MNYHSCNFKKQHCESIFFKKSCSTLVVVDELEVVDEVELLDRVELVRLRIHHMARMCSKRM